ncbi:hypothetical protein RchiOBHm_Chr2g0094701 [Rosa chinensis]|uniref:Uncharacterized protein n=1 Tax=Rosa chinensis TaxID=74649 RepID=A0A2P6RKK8_ROSCH|nr:hypothetical protein RchiOBHm_Chr2g0094701 [Rosa chinensis]
MIAALPFSCLVALFLNVGLLTATLNVFKLPSCPSSSSFPTLTAFSTTLPSFTTSDKSLPTSLSFFTTFNPSPSTPTFTPLSLIIKSSLLPFTLLLTPNRTTFSMYDLFIWLATKLADTSIFIFSAGSTLFKGLCQLEGLGTTSFNSASFFFLLPPPVIYKLICLFFFDICFVISVASASFFTGIHPSQLNVPGSL